MEQPHPPTVPRQLPLGLQAGGRGSVVIRESQRARRLSVRVHPCASVEVVVPRGTSDRRIHGFLVRYQGWIERRVAHAVSRRPPQAPFPPPGLALAALGEQWRVFVAGGEGRPRLREQAPGLLCLTGGGTAADRVAAFRSWLLRRAAAAFEPRLRELAAAHGFAFERLQVRSQRTRWGSCSTRGTITLNVALLFQHPDLLRYVMLHELAHTRHMDHSRQFWRCVAGCEPGFRSLDRRLRDGWRNVPGWLRASPGADAAGSGL